MLLCEPKLAIQIRKNLDPNQNVSNPTSLKKVKKSRQAGVGILEEHIKRNHFVSKMINHLSCCNK